MERKYIDSIYLDQPIQQESYLNYLPVVRYLNRKERLSFDRDVTFLVGENGTGKSTLLEAIAVAFGFNAEGGTRNFTFSTQRTHSELYQHLVISKSAYAKDGFFLRAESFYNVASNIDEMDREPSFEPKVIESYGGVSLHAQSHGESFLAIVKNRFGGNGIYILDEPEAALSPNSLLMLLIEINELVKKNSQFIIATHSPILMAYPNARIYQLTKDGIDKVEYTQTEHYQLTKRFLNNPQKMLDMLFSESI